MSREALSLDISRLVSRVVRGEPIDIAERGAALAEQYPDLGMSGALISQAIERAAGMVGMIRSAPEPPKPPRPRVEMPVAVLPANGNGNGAARNGTAARFAAREEQPLQKARPAPVALPVAALSIDDDLAAAIDAEIGNIVSGHKAAAGAPAPRSRGEARAAAPPLRRNAEARVAPSPAPRSSVETQTPPVAPPQTTTPAKEPASSEPAHGSIFSSFRRALFRT